MQIQCPHCQREFRVPDTTAGKVARCRLCSGVFRIPVLPARPIEPQPIPPATPVVQPAAVVDRPASSPDRIFAQDATGAALPPSVQPVRPAAGSLHLTPPSPSAARRKSQNLVDEKLAAILVILGQFFIAVPLTYVAMSFALTATYESEGEYLLMLLMASFIAIVFLAGAFNLTWFFHVGKFGRITRDLGPRVTRVVCLCTGGFMLVLMIFGSGNERTFPERMSILNGPIIDPPETLKDRLPEMKSGDDAMRAPGTRRMPSMPTNPEQRRPRTMRP